MFKSMLRIRLNAVLGELIIKSGYYQVRCERHQSSHYDGGSSSSFGAARHSACCCCENPCSAYITCFSSESSRLKIALYTQYVCVKASSPGYGEKHIGLAYHSCDSGLVSGRFKFNMGPVIFTVNGEGILNRGLDQLILLIER